MTAVQQYWIVENDVNLVSNLTPVPVADEDAIKATGFNLGSFQTDSTPLDGVWGTMNNLGVTLVTVSVPEYINPFETSDKAKGVASVASVVVASAVVQYDNPYDTADKMKGSVSVGTYSAVQVVVQYDNLYDTADKTKGTAAISTVVIT